MEKLIITSVAVPVLAVLLSPTTLAVRPKAKPPPSAQSKSVQPVLTNLMLAFSSVKYEFLGFAIWVRALLAIQILLGFRVLYQIQMLSNRRPRHILPEHHKEISQGLYISI